MPIARPRAVLLSLGLALGSIGCDGGAKQGTSTTLSGRWSATTSEGASTFELEDRGTTLVMRVDGDEAVARPTSAGRYEGEKAAPQGTLRFVFEPRGAQLAARYTLVTPDGEKHESGEVLYSREATGGTTATPGASTGGRPAALVGHWRFTEVLGSGGVFLVTDTNLVLEADGTCVTWTKDQDGSGDPKEEGEWKTEGDRLMLRPSGGGAWRDAGRFTAAGNNLRLVLPNGNRQLFERQ